MKRVTEIVEMFWPYTIEDFRKFCDEKNVLYNTKLTPEEIEKWSSEFGTAMHEWCLLGKRPKEPTLLMGECYNHWLTFVNDTGLKILTAERKVMYEELYHGTLDAIVEMDGEIVLLDLKFWKCWYWEFLPQEVPTELTMTSHKLAKANLQTYLYEKAQHDYDITARGVVAINPLGLQFKIFRRSPRDKFEEAIKLLNKEQENDF